LLSLFGTNNFRFCHYFQKRTIYETSHWYRRHFFKAHNPDSLRAWYRQHLGIEVEAWGGFAFKWRTDQNPDGNGTTVWNIVNTDTKYFNPSQSTFMINYRVENLDELLRVLRAEGCTVDAKVDESEFGKFGCVMDPEGNRIELWQPPQGQ
jgi:predicted enzyme related to lactoylglutathione lyase